MGRWTWAFVVACGAALALVGCNDKGNNGSPEKGGTKREAARAGGGFSRDAFNREVVRAREELSKSVAAIAPLDPGLKERIPQMSAEEVAASYRADVVPVVEKFRAARVAFMSATDAARKPLDDMIAEQLEKAENERRESVNVFISRPLPVGNDGVQGEAVVGGDQGDDHTVARMTRLGYVVVRTKKIALMERRGSGHPYQPFSAWCVRNGTVDAQTLVGQTKTVPLYVDAPTVEREKHAALVAERKECRNAVADAFRPIVPPAREPVTEVVRAMLARLRALGSAASDSLLETAFTTEELRDLSLGGSREAHFLVERLIEGRWVGKGRALLRDHGDEPAHPATVRVRIGWEPIQYEGAARSASDVEIEADIDGSRTRPLKFSAIGIFTGGEFFPVELNTLNDLRITRENGKLRLRAETRIALPDGKPEWIEVELERR